jgi:hypothetical protein
LTAGGSESFGVSPRYGVSSRGNRAASRELRHQVPPDARTHLQEEQEGCL